MDEMKLIVLALFCFTTGISTSSTHPKNELDPLNDLTERFNKIIKEITLRYDQETLRNSYQYFVQEPSDDTVSWKNISFTKINLENAFHLPPKIKCISSDTLKIEVITHQERPLEAKADFHFRISPELTSCNGDLEVYFTKMNITMILFLNPNASRIEFDIHYASFRYLYPNYAGCGGDNEELILNYMMSHLLDKIEDHSTQVLMPLIRVIPTDFCQQTNNVTFTPSDPSISYKFQLNTSTIHWKHLSPLWASIPTLLPYLHDIKCTFHDNQMMHLSIDNEIPLIYSGFFEFGPFEGISSCSGIFYIEFKGLNITIAHNQTGNNNGSNLHFITQYGKFAYDLNVHDRCRYNRSSITEYLINASLDKIDERIMRKLKFILASTSDLCLQPLKNITRKPSSFLASPIYYALFTDNSSSYHPRQLVIKGLPNLRTLDVHYAQDGTTTYKLLINQVKGYVGVSNYTAIREQLHFDVDYFTIDANIETREIQVKLNDYSLFLKNDNGVYQIPPVNSFDLIMKLEQLITSFMKKALNDEEHSPTEEFSYLIAEFSKFI